MNGNNYDIDDVLRYANQVVWGEQFARAVAAHAATLDAHPMPEEARRAIVEAFEIAVVEAFGLGLTGGWDVAGRWAHIERTLKASKKKAETLSQRGMTKSQQVEAVRALIPAMNLKLDKQLRQASINKLAKAMKKSPRTISRYLAEL